MTGVILCVAFAILASDERPCPASVVTAVLSWQAASVPAALRGPVEREVSAIWLRLGIDVQWRDARPGELSVGIIVKDTGGQGGFAPLGWVNFVDRRPTAVLYASADAAWNTVLAGHTDKGRVADAPRGLQEVLTARLLGRAIAHELGHYLLGSNGHATHGLMRPTLDFVDALTSASEKYNLDRAQREALQQRLALLTLSAQHSAPFGTLQHPLAPFSTLQHPAAGACPAG